MVDVNEIEVVADSRGGTIHKHPAFAQIRASRVSGGAILYGSDFQHQHYVTVSISGSELHRDLSRDWSHERAEYIEIAMSEAQWASFVSSMNVGSGTSCTLTRRNGERIPSLPDPVVRSDRFRNEVQETLADALKAIGALSAEIDSLNISEKQKGALRSKVAKAGREIEANVPFVLKQFGEHMEHTTERAKVEINAYAVSTVMRAGIASLGANNTAISLPGATPPKNEG